MTPADPYALDCPCRCHGSARACNHAGGCGHLHRDIDRRRSACATCRRPTDAPVTLCATCVGVLRDDLLSVPELLDELFTARTGQDRLGRAGGWPANDDQPLGYRPAPLEATERLTIVLGYWAARYAAAFHAAETPPADDPSACARWLRDALGAIRFADSAGDLLDQVHVVVRIAWRVVDRPAPRCYAGPCDCGADLYGDPTAPRLRCGGCGATFATGDRRAWVLDALREHLATAAEIAAGVGELYGEQINRKRINQWHHRGRLTERGVTLGAADPLFRIGDVLELAAASAAVRQRPQSSPIRARHPAEPTNRRRGVSPSPR